ADAYILLDRVDVDRVTARPRQHLQAARAVDVGLPAVAPDVLAHRHPVPADRLVGAVLAGDVAQAAVDALLRIDLGDDLVIQVELAPGLDARHGPADEVADPLEALLQHPAFQAAAELLDEAEAVVHDGGADLDAAGPEQQELDRVLPGLDTADAADRHADRRVAGEGGDHVQGDRLDRRTAVAAVATLAADRRLRRQRVQVHAHDGVEGVDQGQGVGAALDRRPADGGDVGDVRRQLDHHRDGRDLLDPFGDHAGVVGDLADGRPLAALAHAVRAAEVQL